jgi:hypothetical protein
LEFEIQVELISTAYDYAKEDWANSIEKVCDYEWDTLCDDLNMIEVTSLTVQPSSVHMGL